MKLYRYISFRGRRHRKRTRDMILSGLVYFQSPNYFNDPFDCKSAFHYGGATDAEWRRHYENKIRISGRGRSEETINDLVESEMKLGRHKHLTYREEQVKIFQSVLSNAVKKLGMLCLSEVNNDILMWSHYSDGHRGICLQFDKKQLQNQFHVESVQYHSRYTSFKTFLDLIQTSELDRLLKRKSRDWKYEREWRVIHNFESKKARLLRLSPGMLTGVILGCQMSTRDKALVGGWVKSLGGTVQLYEATKNTSTYGVRVQRVT